jgi:septum formation protein
MPLENPQSDIILASASKVRARLLRSAGIKFTIIPANIDEEAIRTECLAGMSSTPDKIAQSLALAKAQAISSEHPLAFVLGADQILVFEDKIITKPNDIKQARVRLKQMRGANHTLISALACVRSGKVLWSTNRHAQLRMREFSDVFMDDYLYQAGAQILSTVGAYEIESLGIQLFDHVEGDLFTIQGLPLLDLLAFLRAQSIIGI